MAKISSGILLYRFVDHDLHIFLVHPGGPYWRKKDAGAWSIPKGEVAEGEDLKINAVRELKEETGIHISEKELFYVGEIKQKGGKIVHAFAAEYHGKGDPVIKSNSFEMEWPPKSGKKEIFPEVDEGYFFSVEKSKEKINSAQVEFIDKLTDHLHMTKH